MKKPRHLSPDERALWNKVSQTMDRVTGMPVAPMIPEFAPKTTPTKMPNFKVGQKVDAARSHNLIPAIADQLRSAPLAMDANSFGKMKRGKLAPEGRIDLHGLTLDQAHPELVGFILNSYTKGKRLVLVITGKGKNRDQGYSIPERFGVLRHQVPQWLNLPPLKQVILQVTPSHKKHGGEGAYYVYLRRAR